MSQPFDRKALIPAPGQPDPELGEFWIGNPWLFTPVKRNLSAYERNRMFWNQAGQRFHDVSYLTSADSDGDGRTAVAADMDRDGRLDLWVRQVSGGPVMLFENHLTPRHYLTVSLRGTRSNRLGVGARIIAEAGGRRLLRELYPACCFLSQQPHEVHFGLDDSTVVDRLTVQWPSGAVDVLRRVPGDQHIRVTEAAGQWREVAAAK